MDTVAQSGHRAAALQRLLTDPRDVTVIDDLSFLQSWHRQATPGNVAALRIRQILRAYPELSHLQASAASLPVADPQRPASRPRPG